MGGSPIENLSSGKGVIQAGDGVSRAGDGAKKKAFLILSYPLTNIEIQRYQNKPRLKVSFSKLSTKHCEGCGICSKTRSNLPNTVKEGEYVVKLEAIY